MPNHKCEESRNLEVEACCSILIIMMTLQIPFFCMRCAIAMLLSISLSTGMVKQWWCRINLSSLTYAVICTFVNKLIVSSALTCFCGSVLVVLGLCITWNIFCKLATLYHQLHRENRVSLVLTKKSFLVDKNRVYQSWVLQLARF